MVFKRMGFKDEGVWDKSPCSMVYRKTPLSAFYMPQTKAEIHLEAGIPVMSYEGNMGNKRELNEAQVLYRIDSFMESLGLRKL